MACAPVSAARVSTLFKADSWSTSTRTFGGRTSTSAIASEAATVGPPLEAAALQESADGAGVPLEDYIRESIVDPNAYLPPGFNPPSTMPSFKATIPAADLDALVQYLAENTN